MKKASIIIPIFNEINTIKDLVEELKNIKEIYEVIIVDDGSFDGTKEFLKECKKKLKDIIFCEHSVNKGRGEAIKTGVDASTQPIIIIYDGDMEVPIEEISKIYDFFIENSIDLCIGSRYLNLNKNFKELIFNKNFILNYIYNKLFYLLFKEKTTDILSGTIAIKKEVFKKIKKLNKGFEFEIDLFLGILENSANYKELEIKYLPRNVKQGKKIRYFKDGIYLVFYLLYRWFNFKKKIIS